MDDACFARVLKLIQDVDCLHGTPGSFSKAGSWRDSQACGTESVEGFSEKDARHMRRCWQWDVSRTSFWRRSGAATWRQVHRHSDPCRCRPKTAKVTVHVRVRHHKCRPQTVAALEEKSVGGPDCETKVHHCSVSSHLKLHISAWFGTGR